MTALTEARTVPLHFTLKQLAMDAARLGALDPTAPFGNVYLVGFTDQAAVLLRARDRWDIDDHDLMRDLFGDLIETVAVLADFDTDPDSVLDRRGLPRTAEMRYVVRGELLADRDHLTYRLEEMAR